MNGGRLQFFDVKSGASALTRIAYLFEPPQHGAPTFVWFCGFKSHMRGAKAEALAAWARERGAGSLRFDYSGHGQSGGSFDEGTISRWLDEAEAVSALAFREAPVVLVGSSMGAWIALLLARRRAASGLPAPKAAALIAPAWDLTRLMWERAPQDVREILLRDGVYLRPSAYGDGPCPITKALIDDGAQHLFGEGPVAVDCPVRILHGCQDPDIPWRRSLLLIDVLAGSDVRLSLIKNGEHRLSRPQDLALLFSTLEEFI